MGDTHDKLENEVDRTFWKDRAYDDSALKRERRYQLLQAAAVIHAARVGEVSDWSYKVCVHEAESLLEEIERRNP